MSSTVKTVADRLTQNMEGQYHGVFTNQQPLCLPLFCEVSLYLLLFLEGRSMDYSEVSSAFSKLVETHFLQRCPPMAAAATKNGAASATPATPATPGTPAAPVSTTLPTPESFPDCYRVPHVTLIGKGKRRLSNEDGEDQRSAKRAKIDSEVGVWSLLVRPLTYLLHF